MERNSKGSYSPYSTTDPTMDVPVTSTTASGIMSPYLNFDPGFISPRGQPEFIFPEGANKRRGRLELAFSQIGGSVFVGAAVGGLNGLYSGMKATEVAQLTGAVKRTQMLNYITKQGASSAQSLGVIALMYSLIGVAVSWGRGVDDELNTLAAGTTTGLLFKSSAGTMKCLRGGGIGFALASAYVLVTSRERLKIMFKRN